MARSLRKSCALDDNQLTSEAKTQSGTSKTTTYTYNRNGDLTKKNTGTTATTISYSYNSFGELSRATVGSTASTFYYLPSGLRFSKTTGGVTTEHFYDGSNVILDMQGSTAVGEYIYGVGLVSNNAGSTPVYYLHNSHGDVTHLTNSSAAVTKTYTYDAFGNEESPVSSDANPFRYAGQYYDKSTGTYYLRARYYDPVIGRFTREDPHWNTGNMIYGDDPVKLASGAYAPSIESIVQSGNRYPYAMNNPVKYTDENGEFAFPAWLIAIGINTAKDSLIDAVITGGAYYLFNGESFWAGFMNGAISGAGSGFGEAIGGHIGKAIGSAVGSGFGTYIEEFYINKETDDFAKESAVQAAVSGALSAIPSKYWREVRKVAIEFDVAASGLMEYDDEFGKLLGDILDGLVTALGSEEH